MHIDQLPDHSQLRIVPVFPALSPESAGGLLGSLEKLFVQFQAEGRCEAFALDMQGNGSLCLLSWLGPALSGCSHDKIGKELALFEERLSVQMLAPPPILADLDGKVTYYTHKSFKSAVVAGVITADTLMWDSLAQTLGAWRCGSKRVLTEHWAYPLFQRTQATMT